MAVAVVVVEDVTAVVVVDFLDNKRSCSLEGRLGNAYTPQDIVGRA